MSAEEELPESFAAHWSLDPAVAHLNHGAFGLDAEGCGLFRGEAEDLDGDRSLVGDAEKSGARGYLG